MEHGFIDGGNNGMVIGIGKLFFQHCGTIAFISDKNKLYSNLNMIITTLL